jgi:hypothetical protein
MYVGGLLYVENPGWEIFKLIQQVAIDHMKIRKGKVAPCYQKVKWSQT